MPSCPRKANRMGIMCAIHWLMVPADLRRALRAATAKTLKNIQTKAVGFVQGQIRA